MADAVRLGLVSKAHDNFFSFPPRPVPGSLSSLLHLHNRQRQPMPASMPGTLPNPTMPGSSAVLMPVSFLCFAVVVALNFILFYYFFMGAGGGGGRRGGGHYLFIYFCLDSAYAEVRVCWIVQKKRSRCNELGKLDIFLCFVLHKSISGAVNGMLISVRVIRNSLHETTVSGSHTWSCQ